jgi:uncharacterized protein YbjT (DUF2867 family)
VKSIAILVTGATGNQGGAVVAHLLQRDFHVRAMVRDLEKPAARDLASRGVELVQGDLDDPESVARAVADVYGVYSVQSPVEVGVAREVVQGVTLADAAREAGVDHFVYSSVGSANLNTGVPHFESKWQIEQHIRRIGLPATIIRPVFFMQNWRNLMREPILQGILPQPLRPETRLQQISVDDIGRVVATAFAEPAHWIGRELDFAGDDLNMAEIAAAFTRVLDRPVAYYRLPWKEFQAIAGEEIATMYRWFEEVGYHVDVAALRREFPWLSTMEQVLRSQDWKAVQSHPPTHEPWYPGLPDATTNPDLTAPPPVQHR